MNNELVLERFGNDNKNDKDNKNIAEIKNIGSDSLFYFGIFLFAFFLLQFIPFVSGLFDQINIGINEVVVSLIGFANVFFLKFFNKIFCKNNNA